MAPPQYSISIPNWSQFPDMRVLAILVKSNGRKNWNSSLVLCASQSGTPRLRAIGSAASAGRFLLCAELLKSDDGRLREAGTLG
jgi:hypothetical protein